MSFDWNARFAERVAGMAASEIRELLKLIERPEIISFAGGVPDPALFPVGALEEAYERVFRSNSGSGLAFQYSVSEGYRPLREWIAAHMAERGVPTDAERVLITNGSQQALEFIGKLLIGPGDPVAVTHPTYLGALQAFSPFEPRHVPVAVDERGPIPDSLDAALAQKPKLFYLVPDFQNPTGVTTDWERRRIVVELCARHGVPLIEDTAYAELRYEGVPPPALAALDAQANGGEQTGVLHCGTFSKVMVPGLRVGWVTGPKPAIDKMVLMKQAADLHTATVNQRVLHDLVTRVYRSHVPTLIAKYRARRDAMLETLVAEFPPGATWTRPEGGMFVWVELPSGIDAARLLERAIRDFDVAFVPGAPFFFDRSRASTMRLGFVSEPPDRIREGVRRLAQVVRSAIASRAAQ